MSLPLETVRDMLAEQSASAYLDAIEIDHPTLVVPERFVRNGEDITYDANLYRAWAFDIQPPDSVDDGRVPTVRLVMDTVDQRLINVARAAGSPPSITYLVLRVAPDGTVSLARGPFQFIGKARRITTYTIEITLGYEGDLLDSLSVRDFHDPNTAPGLF